VATRGVRRLVTVDNTDIRAADPRRPRAREPPRSDRPRARRPESLQVALGEGPPRTRRVGPAPTRRAVSQQGADEGRAEAPRLALGAATASSGVERRRGADLPRSACPVVVKPLAGGGCERSGGPGRSTSCATRCRRSTPRREPRAGRGDAGRPEFTSRPSPSATARTIRARRHRDPLEA